MDCLTKEQRHKNMVANKSHGTKIELLLAKVLWNAGIRYRKNDKGVYGTPDFTIRGYRIAIFCDGEFWHGRDWEVNKAKIKSNRSFWYAKIEHNIERDKQITEQLQQQGWKVFRFWETDIRKHADQLVDQILTYIHQQQAHQSKTCIDKVTDNQKVPIQLEAGQQLAVVSHYLYNQQQPFSNNFELPAKNIINKIYDLNEYSSDIDNLVAEPEIQYSLGSNVHTAPFLPNEQTTFTFVDLFAGIGGIRLALQQLGGRCVFCSEWNTEAQYTYLLNFGEVPFGDINDKTTKKLIPDKFDLLCASIPAQRFILSKRKVNLEQLRGTLFYHFGEILSCKHPKAFLIETDKTILTLDRGETLKTFVSVAKEILGYNVGSPILLKADEFGLPHDTERVYIVGFREDIELLTLDLSDVLTSKREIYNSEMKNVKTTIEDIKESQPVSAKYYLSEQVMDTLANQKVLSDTTNKKWKYEAVPNNGILHVLKGNKLSHTHNFIIDYRLNNSNVPSSYKGVPNIQGIRKLTPRELARLQGFPDNFILKMKDNTSYKLLENASIVTMVQAVGEIVLQLLDKNSD